MGGRSMRGAPAMAALREGSFGAPIELNGRELADIIAFADDAKEHPKLSTDDAPDLHRDIVVEWPSDRRFGSDRRSRLKSALRAFF